jgi:hypothetical protein
MTVATEPRRDWLSIGAKAMEEGTEHEIDTAEGWIVEHRPISRERVERAIPKLQWVEPEGNFPISPGMALQAAIEQLELPKVSAVAYRGEDEHVGFHNYSLYGIEANYKDGRARVYVMDRGHDLVPLCVDFYANA